MLAVLALVLACGVWVGEGRDYYVAANGPPTGNGNAGNPFPNINLAVAAANSVGRKGRKSEGE